MFSSEFNNRKDILYRYFCHPKWKYTRGDCYIAFTLGRHGFFQNQSDSLEALTQKATS